MIQKENKIIQLIPIRNNQVIFIYEILFNSYIKYSTSMNTNVTISKFKIEDDIVKLDSYFFHKHYIIFLKKE